MLSRPTQIVSAILATAILVAAFASVAGAHSHRYGDRVDRRATGHVSGLRAQIVSPSAGEAVSGTVRWSAAVSGTDSARVTFSVDGSKVKTTTGKAPSISLDTATLAEGRHTLSITASGNGRSAGDQVTVSISRHPSKGKPTSTKTETTTTTTAKTETGTGSTGVAPPQTTGSPVTTTTTEPPITTETTPVTTPEESVSTPSSNKILWGAWIGEQFTGTSAPWDMNAVSDFEKVAEKPLSLVNFSSPFAYCPSNTSPTSSCSFYSFPKPEMESIRKHGAVPVFSWASDMIPTSTSEPNFQLSDVIEGKFDSYIRAWATAAKAWGHPFFLRFNWEMNGNWFPWSEGVNGNKSGEFVAAWRHVHDIFTSVGATNATWVWCPNVDPEGNMQNLASLYPGNEYVDWTGLDGYNWGTNPAHPDRWRTFNQLYSSTYQQITQTVAPSKPLMISEVGSTEYGGSKATWIHEMLETIPRNYPKIRGLLWFDNYADGMDWPLESSKSASQAFASGIQSSAYTGSEFGNLPFGAVAPVS